MRVRDCLRPVLLLHLLAGLCLQIPVARAQPAPAAADSTLAASGEPPPQAFDVFAGNANESTKNRGMIGGGGYYYTIVTIAPRYEVTKERVVRIVLDAPRVTKKDVKQQDPGGLALLTWSFALMDMENPSGLVKEVTAKFGSLSTTSATPQNGVFVFQMPPGASRLEGFDVHWTWGRNDVVLTFEAQGAGVSMVPIILAALATLGLIGGRYLRHRRRPKDEESREREVLALTFTRIDPACAIERAIPLQLIRVKATTNGVAGESPDAIDGTLTNPRTGASTSIRFEAVTPSGVAGGVPGGAVFLSDAIVLSERVDGDALDVAHLPVEPEDVLQVACGGCTAALPIVDVEDRLGDPPHLTLEAVGETAAATAVWDPQRGVRAELVVKLTDEAGAPVPYERIVWRIGDEQEAPVTVTDEQGLTRLSFQPAETRGFYPVMEDLPLCGWIGAQAYTVQALPEDDASAMLLSAPPPEFSIDLVEPTRVHVLDENGAQAPILCPPRQAHVRVSLGRADAAAHRGPLAVKVTVPGDTIAVTLSPIRLRHTFESTVAIAYNPPRDGADLVVFFNSIGTSARIYPAETVAQEKETWRTIELLTQIYDAALQSGALDAETHAEISVKQRLAANALAWNKEEYQTTQLHGAVAAAYADLLVAPLEDLGPAVDEGPDVAILPQVWKQTSIRFVREVERRQVERAIRIGRADTWSYWSRELFGVFLDLVKMALGTQLAVYTLFSGRTAEGQKADWLERIAGGATVALVLLPFAGPISRLGRYGHAARAFEKQVMADLRLARLTLKQAYQTERLAVNAARAEQISRSVGELFSKKLTEEAAAVAKVETLSARVTTLERRLADAPEELVALEGELQQFVADRARLQAIKRPLKDVAASIRRTKNAMARVRRGLDEWPADVAKWRARRMKAEQALDELQAGREVSKQELRKMHAEGRLPSESAKIEGVKANRIYQRRVETELGAQSKTWVGERSWPIPAPYRHTTWGRKLRVSRKQTVSPKPDHLNVNPASLHAADSKYWTFWPGESSMRGMSQEGLWLIESRVRQAVDSLEKARLVQFQILRQQNPALSKAAAWEQVWSRQVTIVTPIGTPEYFQNLLRASLRGAGKSVNFQVIPARLDTWAEALSALQAAPR